MAKTGVGGARLFVAMLLVRFAPVANPRDIHATRTLTSAKDRIATIRPKKNKINLAPV